MANEEVYMQIIVLPIFFAMIVWVVKLIYDWKRVRIKSELHHKLVDKFGNVQELNAFLQSKSGTDFLKSLTINGVAPKERLLSALSKGIILGLLGVAFFAVGILFAEESRYLYAGGVVIFALGIGYAISAAISYRLSVKWGIIKEE